MKISSFFLGATAACVLGVALPPRAAAMISDEDFNALKSMVTNQDQRIGQLEKSHEQDQQTHEQDQQTIQQLQQRLGETQTLATNAAQKADAAAKIQPIKPIPSGVMSALHNFTLAGDAEVQFGKSQGQHSTFALADFAPIFLFRANDNVLFEAGFDVTLQNNTDQNGNRAAGSSTAVNLSFAQLDYLYNDYVTLVAGDMLLPLGTYSERSAGWLNKIPDDPLVRDLLPGSGVGAQLRGAVPIGQSGQSLTYSIYGANGPSSSSTNGTANASDLDLGGNVGDTPNWHANPSGGGRIGWFYPWKPHYDIELGVSGQSGEWSDSGNRLWSAAVVDAAVHISPYFEVKGEYINTWVQTDDTGTIHPNGGWVQAGYKLAGLNLDLPVVNDIELVSRYDAMNDNLGTKTDRITAGFVYYLTNTLLFEGDYEWLHSRGPAALPSNEFVVQLSYGF
ncbi:MAG: hypothetical protein ABSH15_14570 [Verrucomicrobiota bacterium]|jgi:hypothetical protein